MIFSQQSFDIKLEWGIQGVDTLLPVSDVIIIVDVLSFSTCVDIATGNGAIIHPYRWKDETAVAYANSLNAELAEQRSSTKGYSLSPASLVNISSGTRLVLPSPNGSTLSLATGATTTICGCIRNAEAVAAFAVSLGKKITVTPSGERWSDDTLRPAFEDPLGAGAIISHLPGTL
ncbi:MAG TPA: 2-phosphosulfolactate phosphatase [Puia sp.]|nr:2-phosphosulfolactate phosphatase [Puia sp.]